MTPSNETLWASDCSFAFSYTCEGNRKILNWNNIIQTCLIYCKKIRKIKYQSPPRKGKFCLLGSVFILLAIGKLELTP